MSEELFRTEDYLTKEAKADALFTESYNGMTREIDRVSYEKVTIFGKLVSWIYFKIFGDSEHVKEEQDISDMARSSKAFKKVEQIFKSEQSDSMSNEDVMNYTTRKFKG
jgi:hypothetical protein